MTRSKLENAYLWIQKSEYFHHLNIKDSNGKKEFWKKIKTFFSNKGLKTNNNKLITNSSTLANLFNNYLINIISTLKLKQSPPNFHQYLTFEKKSWVFF